MCVKLASSCNCCVSLSQTNLLFHYRGATSKVLYKKYRRKKNYEFSDAGVEKVSRPKNYHTAVLRCSTYRRSNTKCHFFDIFTRLILRIFHFYNVLISVQSTSTTHGRVICQRCRTKMMHRLLILSLNAWIVYQM